MENVSKALIMAGGVLVGIVILSLLVTFYSNIRNLQKTQQEIEINEQAIEFNKKFDEYDKENIYGSEFLSLINKVCDYNNKYVRDKDSEFYEGYDEIKLVVKFKNDYKIDGYHSDSLHPNLEYDDITIAVAGESEVIDAKKQDLKDNIAELERILDEFKNPKNNVYKNNDNRNVYLDLVEMSGLGTDKGINYGINENIPDTEIDPSMKYSNCHSEFTLYLQNKKNIIDFNTVKHIENDINRYKTLKAKYTSFKNKKFRSVKFTYDQYTGRISVMEFEEKKETT